MCARSRFDFPKCASLLHQCTSITSLRDLHQKFSAAGIDTHTFLGNHLVEMYGKFGSVAEARLSFDLIRSKNRFSWNIILTAYARNGHISDSISVFQRMAKQDLFTWNSMIAALIQSRYLDDALALLDLMPEKDVVSWNTVLAAYAEIGNVLEMKITFDRLETRNAVTWNTMISGTGQSRPDAARLYLELMPERNLLSWNAMLAAYAQEGHFAQTTNLFANMCVEGIAPDAFTCVSVLDACDLSLGGTIHDEMRSNGWDSIVFVSTAILAMYGRCQRVDRAVEVFGSMPVRNIVTWNALLSAYAGNGHLENALAVYENMPARDMASGNGLVCGYGQLGQWESARAVFDLLPERDAVTWNAIIAAYAGSDLPRETLALFRAMDLHGIAPNRVTFASVLSACDGDPSLQQAYFVQCLIAGLVDLDLDAIVGTALVILYGRCGSAAKSLETFRRMDRDQGAWNSIVAALARNGHTAEAIAMLRAMECEGIDPDFAAFRSVLFACSHGGFLREGYDSFLIMAGDRGIAADSSHFSCLIDLLGRAGELGAAEELIDSMPFEADGLAWTIFLSSCKSQRDVERGAMAATRAAGFDSGESSTYVMLSSIVGN